MANLACGREALLRPALMMLGALSLGGVLIALVGHDPFEAYGALLRGALGGRNLAATLNRAMPIVGLALAAAIALRAGLLNLGGEGQLVVGALAAAVVTLHTPLPAALLMPVGLAGGALAGALYALLARVLDVRFGVPLLVGSLLLNYPARHIAAYLVNHPLRDVASGMNQTFPIPEAARLPALFGSRIQLGVFLVVLLTFGAAWVLRGTRAGFDIRMVGQGPACARRAGIDLGRLGAGVLAPSGGLAGLVGALAVQGDHYRFIDGALTTPLYAWVGLMAALVAGARPLGALAAGLFFAALATGGFGMERYAGVPRELTQVIQGLVILLAAVWVRPAAGEGEGR